MMMKKHEMGMRKAAVLAAIFLAAILIPSFAGMGMSPASGTYNFTKQGGTIQIVVSNPNDYEREFAITMDNLPITDGNRYISKFTPADKITIKAKDFKVFYMHVTPDESVEYGRRYLVGIKVKDSGRLGPTGVSEGIGVSGLESVSAGFYIYFENKGTTVGYGGFEEESTRRLQERMNTKPNYLPLVLAIILVALMLGLLIFFIAKKRKEAAEGGDDEIVVSPQGKGPG
ncbi:MAG: hypothetical protein V1820_06710 [archaeon]